jgi:hypothetical protein
MDRFGDLAEDLAGAFRQRIEPVFGKVDLHAMKDVVDQRYAGDEGKGERNQSEPG